MLQVELVSKWFFPWFVAEVGTIKLSYRALLEGQEECNYRRVHNDTEVLPQEF